MTEERSEGQPVEAIVVCGTCDGVYRVHPGRRTCPHCGGDPSILITTLEPQPGAEEEATAQHEEGGQPPPSDVPSPPPPAAGEPEPQGETGDASGEEPGSPAEGEDDEHPSKL